MWMNSLSSSGACPVCPETKNETGQIQHIVIADLSSLSSLSSQKKMDGSTDGVPDYEKHETGQTHPIDLVPLPMKWTPDKWDGRPCCFLPHTLERFRGVIPPDLRGMRIPSNGLPPFLRGISACGWTLELSGGELHLKRAHPAARNEAGCLGYIRIHAKNVAADWRLWREVVRI